MLKKPAWFLHSLVGLTDIELVPSRSVQLNSELLDFESFDPLDLRAFYLSSVFRFLFQAIPLTVSETIESFLFFELILFETWLWTEAIMMEVLTSHSINDRIPSAFSSKNLTFKRSKVREMQHLRCFHPGWSSPILTNHGNKIQKLGYT